MKQLKKSQFISKVLGSRWLVVGVLVAVVIGGLGAYIWWSQSSWSAYEKKYLTVHQDINTKLTSAFSLQSDTSQERQEKVTRLAALSSDINRIDDSFCRQNALVGWQKAFGPYKMQDESCRAILATTRAFNDKLQPVVEYLRQEQALAKLLGSSPTQAEVAEGDFEGQLLVWRGVYDSVKNTSANGDFEPIKQAALVATEEIVKDWEEVGVAHQSKDKARYLKASQALAAGYDNLQIISSTSATHLAEIVAMVKEAYDKL